MKNVVKRFLTGVVISSMVFTAMFSTLPAPVSVSAENTGYTPIVEGDTVLNEWKFDFGSAEDVAEGYIAVKPDMNVIQSGTYGFLGNDNNGHKLSDRLDSFSMVEGTNIELVAGGGSGLYDAIGSTDKYYPTRFAMKVQNGTYYRVRATVTGLDQSKDAKITLFSEKRHPIFTDKTIKAGETYTVDFSVDVQTVYYEKSDPKGNYVDDLLNVVVVGENSAIAALTIQQVTPGKTLWVLGDSTVCDQSAAIPYFPLQNYAGVGQALSKYVPSTIAVSNHGEGGLNAADNLHFNNVKNNIKPGDYMFVEYGHNHKEDGPAGYLAALPKYYEAAHSKGAYLIIVGPIDRHNSTQYDSSTNTWSSTLSGFSDAGKQYVENLIANGATDVAFVDLNKPCLDWFADLTAETRDIRMTNYYFMTARGAGTDGTHPNDAGVEKLASLFFEEAQKIVDANVPVQADVLRGLVENRSSEQPVPVSNEIISLGWPPNSAWPVMPVAPVQYEYPMVIKDVTMDENGVFKTMSVQVLQQVSDYGRCIIAVYNPDGKLAGVAYAVDQIDTTTGTGIQEVRFNTNLRLQEGQTYAGYVWGFKDIQEQNYPLTMIPYAKKYVPTDIAEYLIKGEETDIENFVYYGKNDGDDINGCNSWVVSGSSGKNTTLGHDGNISYVNVMADGVKDGVANNGSFYLYRKLDKEIGSSGKYLVQADLNYTSGGGLNFSFVNGITSSAPWGTTGVTLFTVDSEGKITVNGTEVGQLTQGVWSTVKYILDMDYGKATVTVSGGNEVTVDIPMYQSSDITQMPNALNFLSLNANRVAFDLKMANLTVAALKQDELPMRKLTISSEDESKGTVAIKDEKELSVQKPMNTVLTIEATPKEGYEFAGWFDENGNAVSFVTEYTLRLHEDITIKAAFKVAEVDPIEYLFKEDFSKLTTSTLSANDWSSPDAQDNMTIQYDSEKKLGNYLRYGGNTNSRGASKTFDSLYTSDKGLVFSIDVKFNKANTDPNEIAVHGGNITYNSNNINYGCTGGYILHIVQSNAGAVTINGQDTSIPDNTWFTVIAVCDFTNHTVDVTVTSFDGNTTYFSGTVNMDDTSATGIKGMYFKYGRLTGGVISMDNIKIYTADQLNK